MICSDRARENCELPSANRRYIIQSCSPTACSLIHHFRFRFLSSLSPTYSICEIPITMIMQSISILILLPVLSFAIPARHHLFHRQTNSTLPFILRAFQPGSPIHLFSLNANDGHFWLGKTTSSSCPAALEPHCPKGTDTALVVLSDEHASLVSPSSPLLTPLHSSSKTR